MKILDQLKRILEQRSEKAEERECVISAELYCTHIRQALSNTEYYEDIQADLVRDLAQNFMRNNKNPDFAGMDELEINPHWVVKSREYREAGPHKRFRLIEIEDWVHNKKQDLGIR